jgi:NAD+ diphosphatase
MAFVKTVKEPVNEWEKALFLLFDDNGHLMVHPCQEKQPALVSLDRNQLKAFPLENVTFLGFYNKTPCYCAHLSKNGSQGDYEWINLRKLLPKVAPDIWEIAGYAKQIHDGNINYAYCGRCGRPTQPKEDEQGRFCETCNLVFYPRISPAVIMAVIRDDQILLARGVNFPNKKMFSVLAGFVEPQERLEDCVKREVFEETGIKVKNVRYFDSQPWPFPDSLMIGFTAEYDSGTITIDREEIAEARWFRADELPLVPGKPTLSGELIRWFVENNRC